MTTCIICGGSGFILYDGLCNECNGTGESDFDYDAVAYEVGSDDILIDELLESKLFQQHEYNLNLHQAIERNQFSSARGVVYAREREKL